MDRFATQYDELGLILRFLKGELPAHEKQAVQHRIEEDALFALAVEQVVNRSADEEDDEFADRVRAQQQVMLENLSQIHQELDTPRAKKKGTISSLVPYLVSIAAVITLLFLFLRPDPSTPNPYGGPLATLLPTPYPDQLTTLGENDQRLLSQGTEAYRAHQYRQAIQFYDSLLTMAPSELNAREQLEVRMNLVSAHIQTAHFQQAQERLNQVREQENPDYEVQTEWWGAWISLKTGQVPAAIKSLEKIQENTRPASEMYQQAAWLQERLEQESKP